MRKLLSLFPYLDNEVTWDEEKKTLTVKGCSFEWLPEWNLPDTATGRVYYFTTLGSDVMLNQVTFDLKQKIRCAGSIVYAPVNVNHTRYDLEGVNLVLDAETDGERMEGLAYVEDPELNQLWDDGEIIGCSIDYYERVGHKENKDFVAEGVHCVGLGFITKQYLCGDPTSRVWLAEGFSPEVRDYITRKALKMSECEIARAIELFEIPNWGELTEEQQTHYLSVSTRKPGNELTQDVMKSLFSEGEPTVEDRLDWLAEDIRSLYNQFWALEETYFGAVAATNKRIDDLVTLLGNLSHTLVEPDGGDDDDDDEEEKKKKKKEMLDELFVRIVNSGNIDEATIAELKLHLYADPDSGNGDDGDDDEGDNGDPGDAGTDLSDELRVHIDESLKAFAEVYGLVIPPIPEVLPPDSHFAFVEPGGELLDGVTTPKELRHLKFRDDEGNYDEVLLTEAATRLMVLITDGEIPHEAAEAARHLLLDGFKSLDMEVPDLLAPEEPDLLVGRNLKVLAGRSWVDERSPLGHSRRNHPTLGRKRV